MNVPGFKYTCVRSKRRTIAIYITKDAGVEVRAPAGISDAAIESVVLNKSEWIVKQLEARRAQLERKSGFSLDYGSDMLYRGREYPLRVREGDRAGFDNKCFYMPPGLDGGQIRDTMVELYKLSAKRVLTDKAAAFSGIMSLVPLAVKINAAKTRWGSCSGKNSINFSWRLILAADDVIDYVVVHELAHIKEHNHSGRFWEIVQGVLPDYRRREEALKALQDRLAGEDWD
ncbi:MAG: SprT family zinc-dependent metalloprotease [Eubacteriales bacterium]|jgi:predicted metal-dependent hydrolase|nr:SprT family zinc-dependent metalloprotease [Eubacteriales bacterium]